MAGDKTTELNNDEKSLLAKIQSRKRSTIIILCLVSLLLASYFIGIFIDCHARVGLASYYGKNIFGKKTASGQIYDMNKLTAAHRHLPFGTKVRVTNLENGKETIVTINDRGPRKRGRIIDLSYEAARQLDMFAQGVVKVKIEVLG
jgi:rare lipoprotein A